MFNPVRFRDPANVWDEKHPARQFARNVRALRKAKKLSQEEAAERAGMNARAWQKVELGEAGKQGPTLRTIVKVARGLGVEPHELLK